MKKFIRAYDGAIAAIALMIVTVAANTTCTFLTYQEKLPEAAKKLRKF